MTSTNSVSPTGRRNSVESHVTPINGVHAIFGGGEDEYLCVKGLAVVALFGGVVALVEVLKRSYSVTVS